MCINCDDNSTNIPLGDEGLQGPPGNDGNFGGYCGKWVFSTSTLTGPASTYLRLNNVTYSAVTSIFINDTNFDSINYQAFLDSFDNGGNFGYIRISKLYDSSVFWLGEVTAVTDNGPDHSIDVNYILSNGSFSDKDQLIVCFSGKGYVNVYGKQRMTSLFGSYTNAGLAVAPGYFSTASATLTIAGVLVWDAINFGSCVHAKVVFKSPSGAGKPIRVKITDKNGIVLWDTTTNAITAGNLEVIDLGAVLANPAHVLNYLTIEVAGDDTHAVQLYSIDIYNQ